MGVWEGLRNSGIWERKRSRGWGSLAGLVTLVSLVDSSRHTMQEMLSKARNGQ